MNPKVIITCAVTGAGDTVGKHPAIPVTPEQIANAALEAAAAGAAVVHCHVRDPKTGKGARGVHLYARGRRAHPRQEQDCDHQSDRRHGRRSRGRPWRNARCNGARAPILSVRSSACCMCRSCAPKSAPSTAARSISATATPSSCRRPPSCANRPSLIQSYGVKPEMEIFDSGNLWFAKQLCAEGLIDDPPLFQLCLGIPWGAPVRHPDHGLSGRRIAARTRSGPPSASAAIEFPMVAQAVLLGGHVRVGLEDNLWLEKGVHATNGTLVEKAVKIIETARLQGRLARRSPRHPEAQAARAHEPCPSHQDRRHRRNRTDRRRLGRAPARPRLRRHRL